MRVYTFLPEDDHELCRPDDWEAFNNAIADGRFPTNNWELPSVRLVHWNQGEKLSYSDTPWWGDHVLILRRSSVDALGAYLREWGELLPLGCEEAKLCAFKANRVIDALSKESDVARFDDGGLSIIWKHEFKAGALQGVDVFKIPDLRVSPIYVTDPFVEKWRATKLRGLTFELVWEGATA